MGFLQTQRLGSHLTAHRNLKFTHIFASDLSRAFMTAEALQRNQLLNYPSDQVPSVVKLEFLREQDFGSLELIPWATRQNAFDSREALAADLSFRPQETSDAMVLRADTFWTDFILPILAVDDSTDPDHEECVAVVSHGIFLRVLWQTLMRKFKTGSVTIAPDVEAMAHGHSLEHPPSWTNTGFLETRIRKSRDQQDAPNGSLNPQSQTSSAFGEYSMTVLDVNSNAHLLDLKRARGGLGSAVYDPKQQSLDGFFTRPT